MCITDTQISDWFDRRTLNDDQQKRSTEIRAHARELAEAIVRCSSPGPDQTAALRKLRECLWTALAGIQLGGVNG